MNEQFPNPVHPEDEKIAQKLSQVAEQTHANAQFAAELEEKLKDAHNRKANPIMGALRQISPALRWAVLMIVLAIALSWSIKTLIPAPQPATNDTPVPLETPTPAPSILESTPTTSSEEGGYDFRGGKLYLKQPLPGSPAQAHVYLLKKDEPATQEQILALADRLGVEGDMYTAAGLIYGTTNFVISDGKQFLQAHSNRYFTYTSNMAKYNKNTDGFPNDNAETIIREFLESHGFDSNVRVKAMSAPGGYNVQPLAPDLLPMQYESFAQTVMRVTLDENGEVLNIDAALMDYDPTLIGEYGIITAEEALQKLLDDSQPQGKMEFFHSVGNPSQYWYRDYPDDQPVTIYGYATSNPSVDPSQPALILIDGTLAVGNTQGMESLDYYTLVRATGQYLVEEDVRKFKVVEWERYGQTAYITGTLHREGDQVILTADDGSGKQYPLLDPVADVPLDTDIHISQLSVEGVIVNGKMDWKVIRYDQIVAQSGGGGGGGVGFYKLNLSGTPVPFTTPMTQSGINEGPTEYIVQANDTLASIALNFGVSLEDLRRANGLGEENIVFLGQKLLIPHEPSSHDPSAGIYTVKEGDTCAGIAAQLGITVQSIIAQNQLSEECLIYVGQTLIIPGTDPLPEPTEQEVEDLRGYLSITIHTKVDGTSTKEYTLEATQENGTRLYMMEGSRLGELDAYNALPILVSGTIDTLGKLTVDSYKIPYPDLRFQIIKGTQSTAQLEGQNVIVFTTDDGKSYVEFLATNQFPLTAESVTGQLGDALQQEVLIIPDETFGGMPVAHVFQSAMIQENGPAMEIQSNKISTFNDSDFPGLGDFTPPNLTITEVELAYYVSNPYYQVNDPNYDQRSPYIQPVWHFHGQYDDGSEFDILIQALKQEFLLQELVPGLSPG